MDSLADMTHSGYIQAEPIKPKSPFAFVPSNATLPSGAPYKRANEEKTPYKEGDKDSYYSDSQASDRGPIPKLQKATSEFFTTYASEILKATLLTLFIGYSIYLGFAISYSMDMAVALIVITSLSLAAIIYTFIKNRYGNVIYRKVLFPLEDLYERNWNWIRWLVLPSLAIGAILYLALDVITEIRQLQSISGMVVFILLTFVFSKHPERVQWRPVVWGFSLQFVMAILVLRWKVGYDAVYWVSREIEKFINYSYAGSAGIFADPFFLLHPFVFMVMPMLVYIGAVMSMLYYWGITQIVAAKMGWLVQITMGTTAIESLGVAANIFLNGLDTMLLLRNYLHRLTKSEFHCFLVGNHCTVAGFAFAIFVMFGAPPQHLLSAAVMSAPACIAVSKLSLPETEESCTKTQEEVELCKSDDSNVIEAFANGASVAGKTVVAVVVNFLAFLSVLAFVNSTLSWLGARVGHPELSFELICSYVFMPLSILMGVDWADSREVAKLVGMKAFTSEVLAYQQMGVSIKNGLLSERSASICTYALCGFSGLSTLAIAVGVWQTICPQRIHEMTGQMLRVIVNANISCFMTACVAGLMYDPRVAGSVESTDAAALIGFILNMLPGYKDILGLVGMA